MTTNELVLTLFFLGFSAALYLVIKINRLLRQRQEILYEQKISLLEEQLASLRQQTSMSEVLYNKQVLRDEFENAKSRVMHSVRDIRERERQLIEAYRHIIHYTQWSLCESFVNQRLNGFFTKLQANYPHLTEQQQLLSLLLLLDLASEDIALIMNFQYSSLPNTKQRLAHKLNLESGLLIKPTLETLLA